MIKRTPTRPKRKSFPFCPLVAAQLAFIGFTQVDSSQQELHDYSANLTGDTKWRDKIIAGMQANSVPGIFSVDNQLKVAKG
jgi:hypothetical protein